MRSRDHLGPPHRPTMQHCCSHHATESVSGGTGGIRLGTISVGKISTHLQFWCGAIRHRKLQHPPTLVDNQSCGTLAGSNCEQYQLIRDKKKTGAWPRRRQQQQQQQQQQDLATAATEDAQIAQKNFVGKILTLNGKAKLSPHTPPPPLWQLATTRQQLVIAGGCPLEGQKKPVPQESCARVGDDKTT